MYRPSFGVSVVFMPTATPPTLERRRKKEVTHSGRSSEKNGDEVADPEPRFFRHCRPDSLLRDLPGTSFPFERCTRRSCRPGGPGCVRALDAVLMKREIVKCHEPTSCNSSAKRLANGPVISWRPSRNLIFEAASMVSSTRTARRYHVLSFEIQVAGPYCTMMLADQGANVIKVERPEGGDTARGGAPKVKNDRGETQSGYFLRFNRNKRSLTLNLKSDEAVRCSASSRSSPTWWSRTFGPACSTRWASATRRSPRQPRSHLRCISGFGSLDGYLGPLQQAARVRHRRAGDGRADEHLRPGRRPADLARRRARRHRLGHERGLRDHAGALYERRRPARASTSTSRCTTRSSASPSAASPRTRLTEARARARPRTLHGALGTVPVQRRVLRR